jgi:hypothetical protein
LDGPAAYAESWLSEELNLARRHALGMGHPEVAAFAASVECVSLGCYCAISRMLQCLKLKNYSYPFDWVRSGIDGVIHLLENQFQDFLTYSTFRDEGPLKIYGSARWGGSFWHHDLESPQTYDDMTRRIERFYGRLEVPPERPRVFVRNVNATREIESAVRLHNALCQALPDASVYLLLIVDLQSVTGPVRLENCENVLFYRVHESVFRSAAPTATGLDAAMAASGDTAAQAAKQSAQMRFMSENYAQAAAFAMRFWAGMSDARESCAMACSMQQLVSCIDQWDGGDPGQSLFRPQKFRGREVPCGRLPMQRLVDPMQVSHLWISEANMPCSPAAFLITHAFGRLVKVKLPDGAQVGHLLQLSLVAGNDLHALVFKFEGTGFAPVGAGMVLG